MNVPDASDVQASSYTQLKLEYTRDMPAKITLDDVRRLSVAERILLVEDIWDSILNEPDAVELTDSQRRELDARVEAHQTDPSSASEWSQAKARIRRRV